MDGTAIAFLIGLVAFALIGLLMVTLHRQAAKRRAAMEALAQQAGWTFSGEEVSPETLGAGAFPLFTHGRARKASTVMRLPGDAPAVMVFDYQYTVGSGKHQTTVSQTVVHVRSPRLSLPPFVLTAENVFHKIGTVFGYHDIDFDSSPEFSKKYLLRSKEAEDRVRDLFTPSVRVYFEQRVPLSVEGIDNQIVVYKSGRRITPEELQTSVEDAQTIARTLGA
jgi:hypothetical protein